MTRPGGRGVLVHQLQPRPAQSSPDHELPDQLLPLHDEPLQLDPDHELPLHELPLQLEPDQLLPAQTTLLQLDPDQLLPVQTLPFHVPPDQLDAAASACAIPRELKWWPKMSWLPVSVTPSMVRWSVPREASTEPVPGRGAGRTGRRARSRIPSRRMHRSDPSPCASAGRLIAPAPW